MSFSFKLDSDQSLIGSSAALLQLRGFLKKPLMLGDGITVGHSGDVITDDARPARFPGAGLSKFEMVGGAIESRLN
jgi:hypothetical protein